MNKKIADEQFDELADRRHFVVNEEQWAALIAMLDAPPSPNPGLERLMAARAPWDQVDVTELKEMFDQAKSAVPIESNAPCMIKLLSIAQDIVQDSTSPEAEGFDTAKWLAHWLEQPQPALGGRKPADFLDTPTGVEIVAQLLGAVRSGAYL